MRQRRAGAMAPQEGRRARLLAACESAAGLCLCLWTLRRARPARLAPSPHRFAPSPGAGGQLSVVHVLISTAVSGVVQALLGGQPLLIIGVAEPIVLIYGFM